MSVSGEFESVSIDKIVVVERIRKKPLTELQRQELKNSIDRLGLIHPPVVTREFTLVAGENRLNACAALGWSHIPIQWSDTLAPRELLSIEIEENVKRVDLDWKDKCDALLKFHTMHVEDDSTWTASDTAEAIGYSPPFVTEQLSVARELAAGNEMVSSAPKYSVAKGITVRTKERAAADELSAIGLLEEAPQSTDKSPILVADFLEWAPAYTGAPFNFLHCDFPYGIDADTFNQGAGAAFGGYKDTFAHYAALCDTLDQHKEALLGTSAHIIFWYSMKHHQWTLERLRAMGLWVDEYPLVWHKSDNKGTLPRPDMGPRRVYEVAFLCSWGERKIIRPVSNVFSGPTQRTGEHMSEKSEDMLAHFFRMVCDDGTRLLDPTAGSGSAIRASLRLGVRSALGLELNPEFAEAARRAL